MIITHTYTYPEILLDLRRSETRGYAKGQDKRSKS